MEKSFIGVRDVDDDTFRKFRAMAIEEKMKLGEALTKAMKLMIEENKHKIKSKKRINSLLNVKPFDFGLGSEDISKQGILTYNREFKDYLRYLLPRASNEKGILIDIFENKKISMSIEQAIPFIIGYAIADQERSI